MSDSELKTQVKGDLRELKVSRALLFKGLPWQQFSSGVEEFGIKCFL